jgi:hypothetical protein
MRESRRADIDFSSCIIVKALCYRGAQRPSSPAAMERSGIAVRCSALLCY